MVSDAYRFLQGVPQRTAPGGAAVFRKAPRAACLESKPVTGEWEQNFAGLAYETTATVILHMMIPNSELI
jgi:hypothetical protein